MHAAGYLHKAHRSVHEKDTRKFTALLEQQEVISETEKKLDAKTSNN